MDPVALAGFGLRNGYHHFLIAGQNEGSSGSPFYDPLLLLSQLGNISMPFTALLTAAPLTNARLSRFFDPDWYMAIYEQVEDLVADGEYASALHHYLTNPTPEQFCGSPDFDENFYSTRHPDVGAAVRAGNMRTGYQHFVGHGRFEDRQPSPWFDPAVYRRNKRVQRALLADAGLTAFDHYVLHGRSMGVAATLQSHESKPGDRPGTERAGKDIFARMAHLWATMAQATPGRVRGTPSITFQQPKKPDVSVVICAFNHFDLTIQTLLFLSGSVGVSFEVILVDNGSIDRTRAIETHVAGLRLIRNADNVGFLRATNQGIEAARGRFVLLLNNDVVLPPTAICNAVQRLASDKGIGAVGGRVVRTHGQLQEAGCMLFSNGSALGYGRDDDPFAPEYDFVRDVDYCSGVFLMLPRPLLTELGGLDLDFGLVELGCEVTVLPMNPVEQLPDNPREGFHETVELLWNKSHLDVPAFFAARETFYDVVWVCRAHNMHRIVSVLGQNWGPLRHAHVVLDTEALACNREAALAALEDRSFDLGRALKRELRQSFMVQDICCVNEAERSQLMAAGHPRVHKLGHAVALRPTKSGFEKRRDILALGSLYAADTPNFDGLRWFIDEIWPIVHAALGDVKLIVAGFVADGLDAAGLLQGPGVEHLGFVPDPAELYDTARVFLAPPRFSAGIPLKVHEAASYGLPVMATTMLADQLGWTPGVDVMACAPDKPADFAAALIALYSDATLWVSTPKASLARIGAECDRAEFIRGIKDVLQLAD